MAYPGPVYPDSYTQKTQVQFGGMNHQKSAGDGEWFQTMNLTSDYYPVMASREPRIHAFDWHEHGNTVKGMCGGDTVYFAMTDTDIDESASLWRTAIINHKFAIEKVNLAIFSDTDKLMAKMGPRLVIFPDKAIYDETDGSVTPLEKTLSETSYIVYSGTYMGEQATANCVQVMSTASLDGYFKVGQGVKIKGVKTQDGTDDITAVIQELETFVVTTLGVTQYVMQLHFYDNTFYFDGDETDQPIVNSDGSVTQTPGYVVSHEYGEIIKREVPDLDVLFVHENRLWGAKGDTIWASALGDPLVWYNFDTVDTASWSLDVLSEGDFTGGCSFLGYPVFFKDNHIYKIYGSVPSDFSLAQSADIGVAPGSGRSLAIAGERLFYLSRVGVMQYTGALPQLISKPAFGDRFMRNGVGGSDGVKYRITCEDENGEKHHFVYDTLNGNWHEESNPYSYMAWGSGNLYCAGERYIDVLGNLSMQTPDYDDMLDLWTWYAESADYTESSPRRKWVGAPLEIRAEFENSLGEEHEGIRDILGAGLAVYIRFDHDTDPLLIGAYFTTDDAAREVLGQDATDYQLVNEGKRSYICKQIPIRTDHYQIIIQGIGRVWIYSIAPQTEQGSSYHGKNGR